MRKRKKPTINVRVKSVLNSLMYKQGEYQHLGKLHCSNAPINEVFSRVKQTLQLMGIKYQVQTNSYKIRVLTDEQIEIYEAKKKGVFRHHHDYAIDFNSRAKRIVVNEVF